MVMIVNSAHAESVYTCLAFSHDGSKIYTGGEEGYVRIWKSALGSVQEPDVAVEGEEGITTIATSSQNWISGSVDACVRMYDAQGSTMEGLVTRATAVPVRCVAIDPKGERVAVTSDELEIKVIDLKDPTNIQKLVGHRKGVRKVTWHPSGTILTSCGSDGDIIVWGVSTVEDPKRLETITGIIPAVDSESDEFAYDCSSIWHPSGKYFVVATRAHDIIAISGEQWQKEFTFADDAVTGAVTALALSANGTYLASATPTGIYIWSTATRKILLRHDPSTGFALVSHIAFSPTQNLIAWTDADGTLTRWPDPIPSTYSDPVKSRHGPSSVDISLKRRGDLLAFDDHEDITAEAKHQPREAQVDDDNFGLDDDNWIIDDIGILDKPDIAKDRVNGNFTREMVSVTKAQPPFQPSSTPIINKKGYLAFNMIGVIEVTDQDTHNVVNVDFHDRSTRAGTHFQDSNKCDLASLGERGALYACPPDGTHPARIMYKPYSGWATSGEWQYPFPDDETIVALAAGGTPPSRSLRNKSSDGDLEGNGNVVVATNRGYLRFFTGGGVQKYLWTLAADVVTMVAGREWVFVVHRDGGTSLDGCQNLSYTLIALDTFVEVQTGRLPLARGSILKWIGISEEGAPAMYDSNGLLSILDRFRRPGQARWVPILDTNTLARRHGKDESYWPVGVSGTLFMCLILKVTCPLSVAALLIKSSQQGREIHPGFPRPLIQEIEVQMPLLNLDVPQGQMEERLLREELHIGFLRDALGSALTNDEISRREVSLDKELIQLIQLACKGDKLQRALDAAALLHHTASFDMAIKVAEFYHLVGLQDKLHHLKRHRVETDRLEDEKDERKRWGKNALPIAPPENNGPNSSRKARFEEFGSSTSVRKPLAPAIPIATNSCISSEDNCMSSLWNTKGATPSFTTAGTFPDQEPTHWDSSFEENADVTLSSVAEGKRKRDDIEASEFNASSVGSSVNKRRAILPVDTPELNKGAKSTSNPFARKAQEPKGNPFARPGRSKSNVATKSNSFFEKVDEANDNATKTKPTHKSGARQTTLFGLPPGKGVEERSREKSSIHNTKTNVEATRAAQSPSTYSTVESNDVGLEANSESQPDNVSMVGPSPAFEPESNSIMTSNVNHPEQITDSLVDIEWPPSPPRLTSGSDVNSTAEVTVN
ncbi:hypothetical protein BU17DRAFT_88972 [Hysterangium stoloniferum]|nr:hypothetical protein BU17DRAFT_88972 [Hysterangium stoloniferum]